MHTSVLRLLGAAVLAVGAVGAGGLLAGCSASSAGEEQGPSATSSAARPLDPTARPLAPGRSVDRVPLGLEVRYVDENGRFRTVAPEDFNR